MTMRYLIPFSLFSCHSLLILDAILQMKHSENPNLEYAENICHFNHDAVLLIMLMCESFNEK